MKPIFVSFFTEGTSYEQEAAELLRTCKEFGLDTDIRGVPSLGSWERNCGQKPQYILARMNEHWGHPIVWLDADARVRQTPALFFGLDCDFGAHWRHGVELLSGTMFFNSTEPAFRLLSAWVEMQSVYPDEWDQRVLQSVIEGGAVPGLKVHRIPSTYTRVFDDKGMGCPVVEHLQASRRLAKAV